jgi:cobalt-zinc-cadmium efflux system outer membrane protein
MVLTMREPCANIHGLVVITAIASMFAAPARAADAGDMHVTWRFVQTALEQNPESRAAAERGHQARATADAMSASLYNPQIEGGFEQFKNDDRRPSRYDVGVAMTIDVGGKRSARAQTGAAQADAVLADAQRIRLDVAHRLISTIAALATGREREKNAQAQDDAARQFSETAQRSFRAGDVGKPDVDIAQLSLLEAQTERRAAEAERLSAELDLQQLCSCDVKDAPTLPALIPAPPKLDSAEMDRLQDRSLDFAVARARVGAARGELDFANRSRVPDPTVSIGVGQDDGQQLYRLSLSIPIPVLNTGEAEARAANRGLAATQLDLEKVRREAAARVKSAYAAYVAAYANLQTWRGQGSAAVAARFNQLRRLLGAGELTTTEYLVQLRETLSSASRGLEIERAAWAAYADWIVVTNAIPPASGEQG